MKLKNQRRQSITVNRTPNSMYIDPSRDEKYRLNTNNVHYAINYKNEVYLCQCSHRVWVYSSNGGIKTAPNRKGFRL